MQPCSSLLSVCYPFDLLLRRICGSWLIWTPRQSTTILQFVIWLVAHWLFKNIYPMVTLSMLVAHSYLPLAICTHVPFKISNSFSQVAQMWLYFSSLLTLACVNYYKVVALQPLHFNHASLLESISHPCHVVCSSSAHNVYRHRIKFMKAAIASSINVFYNLQDVIGSWTVQIYQVSRPHISTKRRVG